MQRLVSSAFFIFHKQPNVLSVRPSAGDTTVSTKITIRASGIFSQYPGCAKSDNLDEGYMPIGSDPNISCNVVQQQPAKLFCQIGDQLVFASILQDKDSSHPDSEISEMQCVVPFLQKASSEPGFINKKSTAISIKVGMNENSSEFSHGFG
jgi:hypothetical protein